MNNNNEKILSIPALIMLFESFSISNILKKLFVCGCADYFCKSFPLAVESAGYFLVAGHRLPIAVASLEAVHRL